MIPGGKIKGDFLMRFNGKTILGSVFLALALVAFTVMSTSFCRAEDMEKLPLKMPQPTFVGTPLEFLAGPTVVKPKPQPMPMVPAGTINLALHKPVTSSKPPFDRSLSLVTDGNCEAKVGTAVLLKPGLQWIQIDLGAECPIYYIQVWHYFNEPCVFHDVIVQVSNDPNFVKGVTTLFNNDQTNSAGLGIGKDREYLETYLGKLIDAKGVKARYVRLYSKGSNYRDPLNRYIEVEVFGLPAK